MVLEQISTEQFMEAVGLSPLKFDICERERLYRLAEVSFAAGRATLLEDAIRWRWFRQQQGWPDTEAAMMGAKPEQFDAMADAELLKTKI